MQAIIDRLDAQFADPGYRYALLRREDWQTLKSVVLAQQTNNKQSTPCSKCGTDRVLMCPNRKCDASPF